MIDDDAVPVPASTDAERVATVRARYPDAAADDYDELVSPKLAPATDALVARMHLARARLVVDVGTGTARLVPLLRRAAPRAWVLGVDMSESMLAVAAGDRGATVAAMDACRLALRSGCADAALLTFVLFLAPDPVIALAGTRRILRPGGSIGVATWGRKDQPVSAVLDALLDAAGAPGDPLPLERSDERMDSPAKLRALLSASGFGGCEAWVHPLERIVDVDQLLRTATRVGTPARRLATLGNDRARAIVAEAEGRLAALPPERRVHRSEVVLATARRPV